MDNWTTHKRISVKFLKQALEQKPNKIVQTHVLRPYQSAGAVRCSKMYLQAFVLIIQATAIWTVRMWCIPQVLQWSSSHRWRSYYFFFWRGPRESPACSGVTDNIHCFQNLVCFMNFIHCTFLWFGCKVRRCKCPSSLCIFSGLDRFQCLVWTTLLIYKFNILDFFKDLPLKNSFNCIFKSCIENSVRNAFNVHILYNFLHLIHTVFRDIFQETFQI